jgi:hypothetical protein
VDHTTLVCRSYRRTQLPGDLDGLVMWQPADAPDQGSEILAIDVLHGEEALSPGFTKVAKPAHILV